MAPDPVSIDSIRGVRVEMTSSTSEPAKSKYGILVERGVRPVIENSIVLDADQYGIWIDHAAHGVDAYIHNNLVLGSGDWGIRFGKDGAPISSGNVVAFNTVRLNGTGGAQGGIFLQRRAAGRWRWVHGWRAHLLRRGRDGLRR